MPSEAEGRMSEMSGTLEDNFRKVTPYTPGEQPDRPGMIKLNTNENPYPPAPAVQKVLSSFDADSLRLYPDPSAAALTTALACAYGVAPEQVFVGVGSDEVLALCFLAFFNSGHPVLFPDITYSFYPVWADLFGIPFERVPVDETLAIRAQDYERDCGGIVFPNPNAPTGLELAQGEIEKIIKSHPDRVVIVDEAYVDFGAASALPLLKKYENLAVVQTFSKSRSLAGARIGYCIANEKLIRALQDVKYSFNSYTMNRLNVAVGCAALSDPAYWRRTLDRIIASREKAKERLAGYGFAFPDSKANFLFVTHPVWQAEDLYRAMREKDLYVRYFDEPRTRRYLRITIGTEEQMEGLYRFLDAYGESHGTDASAAGGR